MKLSRVEIQGFKSFADRTVIKFDADIISIVGPNGCGKSNIADAIRWAMGEQSTKRLRAQEMENIVFSGSDTRGPMSMAEVSLFFRNDGIFDHPIFGSCEEISVSRRYFHTSDSEYLINNVPCRRKDIQELLSAAGASSKIYSVVEQGRIGWIVISRPEEKRQLIEEAAGVSVYKSKIQSVGRKMEKTAINLQRISDVIREMESTLTHLRRQAQKARRFKKYQDELMDLELHCASHQYLAFLQNRRGIDMAHEEMKQGKGSIENRISVTEGEMEAFGAEISSMEETMTGLQADHYAAQNESALLAATIQRGIEDVRSLKDRARSSLAEAEKIRAKRETCLTDIRSLEEKREDMKLRLREEKETLGGVLEQLEGMKSDQARLLAQREEDRQKLVELASRIASLQAKQEEGERSTGEVAGRLDRLSIERSEAEGRIARLETDILEKRRELQEIEGTLEARRGERTTLGELLAAKKEEISLQDRKIEAADETIFEIRSEIQSIESSLEKNREEAERRQAACSEISSHLLADRIACAEGYETALDAVLERLLDCVVVSDLDAALAWHLKLAGGAAEASFIPRSAVGGDPPSPPPFDAGGEEGVVPLRSRVTAAWDVEGLVDRLLCSVFVVRDIAHAAELHKRAGGRATFVTSAGELVTPHGALLRGGRRSGRQQDLRLAGRLDEKKRELAQGTQRRALLASGRDDMRARIKEITAGIEALQGTLHETEKDLLRKQQEIDAASVETAGLATLVAELDEKLSGARSRKSDAENELREISLAIPALCDEAAALEAGQKSRDGRIEEAQHAIEEKMILMGARRSSIESVEKDEGALAGEIARLHETRRELEDRAAELERETVAGAQTQGRKLAEIFLAGERSEDVRLSLGRLGAEIENIRTALNERKFRSREKEVEIRAMRKQLEECDRRIFEIQTQLITMSGEIERISQNVALRWRRDLQEIVYDYHNRPAPDGSVGEKIDELTKILERMGPVNLLAIDDYQKTEEKYQFYLKEKTDLEEAIEKFKVAISKMNREYKRKFIEAFETINENFRKIFPMLFCGGHAYLELLDPAQPLETGVEIKAQPPGKKLGNLEMMSGGEKALTAIALIFSIFRYRPSPFCILDEVDAPLDEVNVKRFNDMLRSMTGSSQFILMTHSKLTMQGSDILYGVTMQEPGISKVMSTKIEKAVAAAEGLTAAVA